MRINKTKNISLTAAALCVSVIAAAVFMFPVGMKQGVIKGLSICGDRVIPSLFLFTVITVFAVESGLTGAIGKVLYLPGRVLGLSGEEFSVFLFSLISGYPVGARLISELYSNGKTDLKTAKRMLSFCVNAGPAFIIIACGEEVFGSASVGVRLFAAHISASVIIALFSAEKHGGDTVEYSDDRSTKPVSEAFVSAVSGASSAIVSVSAYVVFFSGVSEIVSALPLPLAISNILSASFEVTNGVSVYSQSPVTAAFLLGFGGISVQLQVMSAAGEIKPGFFSLFSARVCHGILSSGIFAVLYSVGSKTNAGGNAVARSHGSPLSAGAFLLLAAVMLCFSKGIKKPPCKNTARRK